MQYLLNKEEYQEYKKLKNHNVNTNVHNRIIEQEKFVEEVTNEYHDMYGHNFSPKQTEDLYKLIWNIFGKLSDKHI